MAKVRIRRVKTYKYKGGRSKNAEDYQDEIGVKYGKLTVTSFSHFRFTPGGRRLAMVNCICECGGTKSISIQDLRRKAVNTCGNKMIHYAYKDRSMPAFNQIYRHSYKFRALKAGIEFAITEDEFRTLSQQTCHYCGTLPESTTRKGTKGKCKTGDSFSIFVYNGLDRKDSSKGYTLDNVVPCCGTCNHAKHTMGYEMFTAWIARLVAFQTSSQALEAL